MDPLIAAQKAAEAYAASKEVDPFILAKAQGLLAAYDTKWREVNQELQLESIERQWLAALRNPDTGRSSRTFGIGGLTDKVVTSPGCGDMPILVDHKTTSEDISPGSPYWQVLALNTQPLHYSLLLLQCGVKLSRVVWDVVKKPQIKPKKISKRDQAELSRGIYCGQPVHLDLNATEETPYLYEVRVFVHASNPESTYFARQSVTPQRGEVLEYARELWSKGQAIRETRAAKRWWKNPHSCFNYGRPCRFLGLCTGRDQADSGNWTRSPADDDWRDRLSNSRLTTFAECPRKFFWHYEQRLREVEPEEEPPLTFGKLWHVALDYYWLYSCDINEEREAALLNHLEGENSGGNPFAS